MEIQKKLLNSLKSEKANAAAAVGIAGVSIANPIAGLFLTASHEIAGLADEIRIDAVVKGLSTELNQEKQINQLYGYIEKSEDNAFYVANTLRKALLADSLIACTVMGRILARHVKNGSRYDQDDNIIFHALENATDDDIRHFYRVMKQFKIDKGIFRIPIADIDASLSSSMDWGVNNRIFRGLSSGSIWEDIGDEGFDTSHSPTNAAEKLYEYVESVKQVLDYGL